MGKSKNKKPLFVVRNEPQLEPATVVKNANIAALITRNSQSPLFRVLPREIRDEIWGYVIGAGGLIHLATKKDKSKCRCAYPKSKRHHACDNLLVHEICILEDDQLAEGSIIPSPFGLGFGYTTEMPHKGCGESRYKIDLNFLFSCRELYIEATQVMYKQLTFSFHSLGAMGEFVLSRNETQKKLLRKIHLDLGTNYNCRWLSDLQSKVGCDRVELLIGHLKHLKTLHLHGVLRGMKPALTRFRVLDLETVTVRNALQHGGRIVQGEDVEILKKILLNPNGAELEREKVEQERAKNNLEQKEKRKRNRDMDSDLDAEIQTQPKRLMRSANGWSRRDDAS